MIFPAHSGAILGATGGAFRRSGGLHVDTKAWIARTATNGGSLTPTEIAAHDIWRRDIGDTIAAKFRAAHFYWVGNSLAKRTPYFATWGPSLLTVEGSPGEPARGYSFTGIAGQRIRTGITPSSQSGFSQFDQFFLLWTYGRNDPMVSQAMFGARTGGSAEYRTGINWVTGANSLEVNGGNSLQANNNYTQTEGPFSGSIGLRALSGTAESYRNALLKTTTSAYSTDDKPAAELWVGGLNGMGAQYFNGDVGCWFIGKGLTDAEYVTVSNATQKLADTLALANTLVSRGDSLIAAGSGMDVASYVTDPTLWFQYSVSNFAVGGTTIAQIQTALDSELAPPAIRRDRIGVYSAGRNDFRNNADVADMTTRIMALMSTPNSRGRYRYMEIPPMEMGNNDEDAGYPFFIRRVALNDAVESIIGQRMVRVVEALRASATLSNASDIATLDRGLTPTTMRGDTVHPSTAGKLVMAKALWETLRSGLGTPVNAPSNYILPLVWIAATTGSNATVGQVLKVTPGGWRGNPVFSFQWQRNGIDISGATSNTYTTVLAGALTCIVSAINPYGGPVTATSNTITVA
jgi:hypothetical protein